MARDVSLDAATGELSLEMDTTRVDEVKGVPRIPLLSKLLMEKTVPVGAVWKLLPWNRGRAPVASTFVRYCDDTMRVMQDRDGEWFVYLRRPIDLN